MKIGLPVLIHYINRIFLLEKSVYLEENRNSHILKFITLKQKKNSIWNFQESNE
jgi:hypothetical protein